MKVAERLSDHMPEPPQLPPFNTKEQWLYSSHPMEASHFGSYYVWSHHKAHDHRQVLEHRLTGNLFSNSAPSLPQRSRITPTLLLTTHQSACHSHTPFYHHIQILERGNIPTLGPWPQTWRRSWSDEANRTTSSAKRNSSEVPKPNTVFAPAMPWYPNHKSPRQNQWWGTMFLKPNARWSVKCLISTKFLETWWANYQYPSENPARVKS